MLSAEQEFKSRIERILDMPIRRVALYKKAFTHSSFAGDCLPDENCPSYERLEFLGDSVLGFIVAELIFRKYKDLDEGELTKLKSSVVSEPVLYRIASDLGLHELLILGRGEELSDGREKPSIRADIFESLVGALFIDRGATAAKKFIHRMLLPEIGNALKSGDQSNYKSRLQEELQARFKAPPYYKVVDFQGPDHHRIYTVRVKYLGRLLGEGQGSSKKEAEQQAANDTLARWSEFFPDDHGL